MIVNVLFFGHYSDYVPNGQLALTLAENATVRDLAQILAERDSRLAKIAAHCRFAVDEEYASLEQPLQKGSTVAVLPPMSGG